MIAALHLYSDYREGASVGSIALHLYSDYRGGASVG